MIWNFVGEVASKRLLPTPTGYYRIAVSSWYYNDMNRPGIAGGPNS
jgi:hypothetical protein